MASGRGCRLGAAHLEIQPLTGNASRVNKFAASMCLGSLRSSRSLAVAARNRILSRHRKEAVSCRTPGSEPNENRSHRSEEHTSELQSPCNLVCRLLLE